MEKEYAIGIDLGGTSVKYALIDNEGVFYFQGKLPSKADVSAEAVICPLYTSLTTTEKTSTGNTGRGKTMNSVGNCTATNGSLRW